MAAAVGVGSLTYGIIKSENQKSAAKKIAAANPFTPEQTPLQVKEATQLAQQNYTNGMPGESLAKQGIDRNSAMAFSNASKSATSGGDLADAANKEQYSSNIANQGLALQAASYKSDALGGYENALNTEAGWQDKLYQNNTLQPYLRAANTAASMEGAANINEAQTIDNAGTSALTLDKNLQNAKLQKQLLGTGGSGSDYSGSNPTFTTGGLNTDQIMSLSSLYRNTA